MIAFSAALNGLTTGFTILSYVDELYLLFQVTVFFHIGVVDLILNTVVLL